MGVGQSKQVTSTMDARYIKKTDQPQVITAAQTQFDNRYIQQTKPELLDSRFVKQAEAPMRTLWCSADGATCSTPLAQNVQINSNTTVAGDLNVTGKLSIANLADFQGPKGDVGPAGPQGNTGPAGPAGPVGPVGPQGLKGDVGPVGPQGLKGATGATGPVGPQGIQGPIGLTGPAGPQGLTGAIGPIGPQGLKGDKGDVGAQGATGPQGPVGPPGAMTSNSNIAMNDKIMYLRALDDATNALNYDATVNGPVIAGCQGGSFVSKCNNKTPLTWDKDGVTVNGSLKVNGEIQIGKWKLKMDANGDWLLLTQDGADPAGANTPYFAFSSDGNLNIRRFATAGNHASGWIADNYQRKNATYRAPRFEVGDWSIWQNNQAGNHKDKFLVFQRGTDNWFNVNGSNSGVVAFAPDGNVNVRRGALRSIDDPAGSGFEKGWVWDGVSDVSNTAVRFDKPYAVQSSRGGFLQDAGGWVGAPAKLDDWQVMYFRKTNL